MFEKLNFCYHGAFFSLAPNELLDATAYEIGAPSYRPRTKPKASCEVAQLKTRKL